MSLSGRVDKAKLHFAGLFAVLLIVSSCGKLDYQIATTEDGGFRIRIDYEKRSAKILTAEGVFPVERGSYEVHLIGKGEDWSYKGARGRYYAPEKIRSNHRAWDYCHAWLDERSGTIYLNAYWICPPDRLARSNISGRFHIAQPR